VEFVPARNKLEVVARISNLTNSGPETLGPGSKEHKSVVLNLARGMGLAVSENETKQGLAARIVETSGRKWTSDCESIGQTLTLVGLNLVLQTGIEYFQDLSTRLSPIQLTLEDELKKISEVVLEKTPRHMDGVSAINEMKEAEVLSYQGNVIATWKAPKLSFRLDSKRLEQEEKEVYERFKMPVQSSRRLVIKSLGI
jgi:hypothetical protein